MITLPAPSRLRVDGRVSPVDGGETARLTWETSDGQHRFQVVVETAESGVVWDSGVVESEVAEAQVAAALRGRTRYSWRVRVAADAGEWSPWSDAAWWETSPFDASEWTARWIARAVPAANRITRSLRRDRLDVAGPGDVLAQRFLVAGEVRSVSFDLSADPSADVILEIALVARTGEVVASREFRGPQVVWDRFLPYVAPPEPLPPGEYEARLTVTQGEVGWYTSDAAPDVEEDDGVSPLPLRGVASRNGDPTTGVRAVGVETSSAANPVFRRRFHLDDGFTEARLSGVALGVGRFLVNGEPVEEIYVEPAPTDFGRRALFRTWDVGPLLRRGENEIVIEAGRGTFAARGASVWAWNLAEWHQEPMAIAELRWRDVDSEPRAIGTDGSWETSVGEVESELLYAGEISVTRASPGEWSPATIVARAPAELSPADLPPVRATARIPIVVAGSPSPTIRVLDAGRIVAGIVELRVRGAAGSGFRVRCAEVVSDDGRVRVENVLIDGDAQTDAHRFEVGAEIVWRQRFGYRGFRFVEIETFGDVEVHSAEAVQLHTDVESVGEFESGHPVFSWWDRALRSTFLNNLHGIPTDTPIYEKNGWTADAHLATEAVLHQVDLRHAYGKWMRDHADAQDESGVVPQIVPTPGFGRAADPAWSASCVLIPWMLYREYGDLGILTRSGDMVRRYADALIGIAGRSSWPGWSWGDWLAPGYGFPPEGRAAAATAMMVSVLQHASEIMTAIGRDAEAREYRHQSRLSAQAYHDAYFDPAQGFYASAGVGYRQALNVLPLAFGIVPNHSRDAVGRSLVDDIEGRTHGRLDTGAVASRYLLDVLSDLGRDDLALSVATDERRPGWGFWYAQGESTLMEAWDASARSRSHYFLGGALSWAHQRLGAARLVEPGWAAFEVDPVDDPRVGGGSLRHRTPRGEIAVRWRRTGSGRELAIDVPWGSRATVAPRAERVEIGPGTHRIVLDG